jgi:hypothetical protein
MMHIQIIFYPHNWLIFNNFIYLKKGVSEEDIIQLKNMGKRDYLIKRNCLVLKNILTKYRFYSIKLTLYS